MPHETNLLSIIGELQRKIKLSHERERELQALVLKLNKQVKGSLEKVLEQKWDALLCGYCSRLILVFVLSKTAIATSRASILSQAKKKADRPQQEAEAYPQADDWDIETLDGSTRQYKKDGDCSGYRSFDVWLGFSP